MTKTETIHDDKRALVRIPNVLAASIGEASKRERKVGRYHVSDLLGLGAVACAELYAGMREEDAFPAYLSKRGLALEGIGLAALPEWQRQAEVYYELDSGISIVGHPDGITFQDDGDPVLIECASQLSADDDAKEEGKLDQVLGYAGLANMPGGRLSLADGTEVTGTVSEARIQLLGLWEGAEIPYIGIIESARERAEWLISKVVLVDDLARVLAADDALSSPAFSRAQRWDERYPSQGPYEYEVAPVLEGERGEEADKAIAAYGAWKDAEKDWLEHKKRWNATLDLQTLKKVKAPTGGGLTLRARKLHQLDQASFEQLGGPGVERELAEARLQVQADTDALRVAWEQAVAEHEASKRVAELEAKLSAIKQGATRTTEVPNGILVTRPRKQ